MRCIIRLKYLIFVLALVFIGQSLSARVKYDKSMEPFIGVWTMQDKLGNDYEYKFQVEDGWVVLPSPKMLPFSQSHNHRLVTH